MATALPTLGRTRRQHRQPAKLHMQRYSFEMHLLKTGSDIRTVHHLVSHANVGDDHNLNARAADV